MRSLIIDSEISFFFFSSHIVRIVSLVRMEPICYHIVVKHVELEVVSKILELEFPIFAVTEMTGTDKEHCHIHIIVPWKEDKLRRQIDKLRADKKKGVSIRAWDQNYVYFCKGEGPGHMPVVIKNTAGLSDADIAKLNEEWWMKRAATEKDPDYKPPSILDELVHACRDQDFGISDVIDQLIEILYSKNGKKMCAIKSTAQAYIRTALLYTKNGDQYKSALHDYYRRDLFVNANAG